MTKDEFIKKLKAKLSKLDQKEIDDIISEYEGFIDEKKASGMSEKEAVKSLGDVNEIAKDLLNAYKIEDDYSDLSAKEVIDTVMDKTVETIDNTVKAVEKKSAGEIVKMIIEVLLLLLIIRLCKIPVDALLSIAHDTFNLLGRAVGSYLFYIVNFIANMIYFILAVVFFFRILKEKIIGSEVYEEVEVKQTTKKEENKNDKKTEIKKEEKTYEAPKEKTKGVIDLFAEIILCFIKFIVACIAIGNICFIVGMSTALAVMVYSIIKGVTYFGPALIIFALLMFGACFLEVFIRFIFNQKQRVVRFIITLISSLIIGGVGIGIFSIEIANTTIVDKMPQSNIKTSEEIYNMDDNAVISSYLVSDNDYVVDENLTDKIKIEYIYNNRYLDLDSETSIDVIDDYKVYHMNYSGNWSKKSFDRLVSDLKKKKLYNIAHDIDVKVYSSSVNIQKLKENREKYTDYSRCFVEDGVRICGEE